MFGIVCKMDLDVWDCLQDGSRCVGLFTKR